MDRRFISVLTVSLVFAAGTTTIFYLLTGPEPHPGGAALATFATIVLVVAILYFGLRGSSRERCKVEEVIQSSLGIRPWTAVAAAQWTARLGRNAAIGLAVGVVGVALCYFIFRSFRLAAMVLVWLALLIMHLRSGTPWRDRISSIAGMSAMFLLLLPDDLFPRQSLVATGVAGVLVVGSMAVSLRSANTQSNASAAVRSACTAGDYAAALSAARDLGPTLTLDERGELSALATAHLRRREFGEAEALLRQALSAQSNRQRAAGLCVALASVFIEQGRFDEALRSLDAAAELGGAEANARTNEARALVLLRSGRDPESALRLAGDAARTGTARAILVHAWALAENGRTAEARKCVLTQATLGGLPKPEIAECSYYAGRALARCGDCGAAVERFRDAIAAEAGGLFGILAGRSLDESVRTS